MNIFQALILSIIEGITEFLPVSSTGHMILAAKLMNIGQSDFSKSFEIIIQLGAILAVAVLYWKKIIKNKDLWLKISISFIPTAVVGLFFYKYIKEVLLSSQLIVVISLFLGGIILLFTEKLNKNETLSIKQLSGKKAAAIGFCQAISIIPGVSRSAATIIGGLLTGLSKKQSVEYSFYLAIPTMAAAGGLDLVSSSAEFTGREIWLLLAGFTGAFLTALFAVRTFLDYIKNHDFKYFGIYRMAIAVLYFLIFIHPLI